MLLKITIQIAMATMLGIAMGNLAQDAVSAVFAPVVNALANVSNGL